MLGSFEDTLEMSKAIEGVEPCIDFAHLHARPGDGTMNTYDEWVCSIEDLSKGAWEESPEAFTHPPFGIEYGPKGEKNHLPVAESDLKLNFLFQSIERVWLRRTHPLRKPHHGRGCAQYEESLDENKQGKRVISHIKNDHRAGVILITLAL